MFLANALGSAGSSSASSGSASVLLTFIDNSKNISINGECFLSEIE